MFFVHKTGYIVAYLGLTFAKLTHIANMSNKHLTHKFGKYCGSCHCLICMFSYNRSVMIMKIFKTVNLIIIKIFHCVVCKNEEISY
jgi:hypothetical protein